MICPKEKFNLCPNCDCCRSCNEFSSGKKYKPICCQKQTCDKCIFFVPCRFTPHRKICSMCVVENDPRIECNGCKSKILQSCSIKCRIHNVEGCCFCYKNINKNNMGICNHCNTINCIKCMNVCRGCFDLACFKCFVDAPGFSLECSKKKKLYDTEDEEDLNYYTSEFDHDDGSSSSDSD